MKVLQQVAVIVMATHWFLTMAALACGSVFVASVLGVLPPLTGRNAWATSPWFSGPVALMFLAAAVVSWRNRPPPLSDEQRAHMVQLRLAEITNWLQRRISIDEAPVEARRHLEQWLQPAALPGDEVWSYDNGEEAWAHLAGESGFALVRGGKVVQFLMWEMN